MAKAPIPITSAAELGAAIRARRKSIGMVQEDVASCVGLYQNQLSLMERGAEGVSIAAYLRVLKGLGLDLQVVPR